MTGFCIWITGLPSSGKAKVLDETWRDMVPEQVAAIMGAAK